MHVNENENQTYLELYHQHLTGSVSVDLSLGACRK